ncbi:DUF4136 domain-containing protein [Sphingomonas arenae]|uniref:DUF4136 domain-containing protein n=1 Tax=Sphingomonas arenae TaxID=2812555 RepID=UPI001F42DF87|nr:DUF4136 domain-containing protein [Sphingomonas arenae]
MNMIKKAAAAVLAGVAAIGLSGCATGLPAKVTRFQAMPAPQGQSFYIVPGAGEAQGGGLEFSRYAAIVAQQMQAQGYAQAASPQQASMIVQLGYGVDKGTQRIVEDPFVGPRFYDPFYSPRFGVWYGRPYYSRFGYYGRFGSPFYYGWDDPFWFGDRGIRSYTEYRSELELDIRSRATNQSLFEGKAVARSTTDELGRLVPNLIEAMFTNFPGRNGETVRITVPPAKRSR